MQCVDAETLAAWADGGLPKTEAAAVELHLSECDRCTAMLATFVRTTPDAPAVESLWRRWNLRWLVPVATAATVAALWVLIPSPEPVPTAMSESDVAIRRHQQHSRQRHRHDSADDRAARRERAGVAARQARVGSSPPQLAKRRRSA